MLRRRLVIGWTVGELVRFGCEVDQEWRLLSPPPQANRFLKTDFPEFVYSKWGRLKSGRMSRFRPQGRNPLHQMGMQERFARSSRAATMPMARVLFSSRFYFFPSVAFSS